MLQLIVSAGVEKFGSVWYTVRLTWKDVAEIY